MDRKIISILLADEHPLYREALAMALSQSPSFLVIGQCGNGPDAEQLYDDLRPDILVIDITMQTTKGFLTTSRILMSHPDARIIWMSTFFKEAYVSRIPGSGALGYITKSMSHLEMLEAIRKVYEGEVYICQKPGRE